jgi:hypothetical protein
MWIFSQIQIQIATILIATCACCMGVVAIICSKNGCFLGIFRLCYVLQAHARIGQSLAGALDGNSITQINTQANSAVIICTCTRAQTSQAP